MGLNEDLKNISHQYEERTDLYPVKGADEKRLNSGTGYGSLANKLHIIKLRDASKSGYMSPVDSEAYKKYTESDKFNPKTFSDLCLMEHANAIQYDPDDFLYCKNIGFPLNRLITLRRFPYPCVDNIWEKDCQPEPDIARMVTYFDHTTNRLEDILGMSYRMKWKQLEASFQEASMAGDQSGFTGYMKKIATVFDGTLASNTMQGVSDGGSGPYGSYNPTHDANKVYGPVDSITSTHIRDVGLEFEKDFEITFEYELRSIAGRTPEFAMKDVLANILACTYNNGKFWGGARFWIGERPSKFFQNFAFLNSRNADKVLFGAYDLLKTELGKWTEDSQGRAVDALKSAMKNGIKMALGKILDKVGRPSILMMDSLLNNEATGYWHLMIGNPTNPIMSIGNLILDSTEISFPTDSLSYGDFPTKMMVKCKLKPSQPKDRAGIEMMFNAGRERIYHAPKTVNINKNATKTNKTARNFFGFETTGIDHMVSQAFDFLQDGVDVVVKEATASAAPKQKTTSGTSSTAETTSSPARNNIMSGAGM